MLVAHSSATALEEHHHFAVGGDVADVFACLSIINDCATRNIDVTVFAVGTRTAVCSAVASMAGKHMSFVAKVQERPIVVVATQIDVAASAAIAAIRSAHRDILGTMHVHGATTAFARAATYLDVIYEVAFCHCLEVRG